MGILARVRAHVLHHPSDSAARKPSPEAIVYEPSHRRSSSQERDYRHPRRGQRHQSQSPAAYHNAQSPSRDASHSRLPALPATVLRRIFAWVCPHANDTAYTSCEESAQQFGCSLCDTRDLARCSRVSTAWAAGAQDLLYQSIRFDVVHFCDREDELAPRRRRRSFLDRSGEPRDAVSDRFRLFSQTVRDDPRLAARVRLLKIPYMLREASPAALARTVSVLSHLRYVDLPDGFARGEESCSTLRQELQSRCPEIRRMKYEAGSESSLSRLAKLPLWRQLEILELQAVSIEPEALRCLLAALPDLQEIRLAQLPLLDASCFTADSAADLSTSDGLPLFPAVATLCLEEASQVSAMALATYLSRADVQQTLRHLVLSSTGVALHQLHLVLQAATSLQSLTVRETITRPFTVAHVPLLASSSLTTLTYEILPTVVSRHPPSESYYTYIAQSVLAGGLPSLTALFAISDLLPDLLIAPPHLVTALNPSRPVSGVDPARATLNPPLHNPFLAPAGPGSRHSAHSSIDTRSSSDSFVFGVAAAPLAGAKGSELPQAPFSGILSSLRQPLALYTRSPALPEREWSLTTLEPPSERNGRKGSFSATRPLSFVQSDTSSTPFVASNGYGNSAADRKAHNATFAPPAIPAHASSHRSTLAPAVSKGRSAGQPLDFESTTDPSGHGALERGHSAPAPVLAKADMGGFLVVPSAADVHGRGSSSHGATGLTKTRDEMGHEPGLTVPDRTWRWHGWGRRHSTLPTAPASPGLDSDAPPSQDQRAGLVPAQAQKHSRRSKSAASNRGLVGDWMG